MQGFTLDYPIYFRNKFNNGSLDPFPHYNIQIYETHKHHISYERTNIRTKY